MLMKIAVTGIVQFKQLFLIFQLIINCHHFFFLYVLAQIHTNTCVYAPYGLAQFKENKIINIQIQTKTLVLILARKIEFMF